MGRGDVGNGASNKERAFRNGVSPHTKPGGDPLIFGGKEVGCSKVTREKKKKKTLAVEGGEQKGREKVYAGREVWKAGYLQLLRKKKSG